MHRYLGTLGKNHPKIYVGPSGPVMVILFGEPKLCTALQKQNPCATTYINCILFIEESCTSKLNVYFKYCMPRASVASDFLFGSHFANAKSLKN